MIVLLLFVNMVNSSVCRNQWRYSTVTRPCLTRFRFPYGCLQPVLTIVWGWRWKVNWRLLIRGECKLVRIISWWSKLTCRRSIYSCSSRVGQQRNSAWIWRLISTARINFSLVYWIRFSFLLSKKHYLYFQRPYCVLYYYVKLYLKKNCWEFLICWDFKSLYNFRI